MTIPKNTNRAKQAIKNAHDIRCYSLSNNFSGNPLAESPAIWFPTPGANGGKTLQYVSQSEFLLWELHNSNRSARLTLNCNRYTLHIHSNLWYEFRA